MWQLFLTALAEMLAGAALKWLRDIFARAAKDAAGGVPGDPHEAMAAAFREARARLTWWDEWVLRRGRKLARIERVCLRHAPALLAHCRGEGRLPVLSGAEYAACAEE